MKILYDCCPFNFWHFLFVPIINHYWGWLLVSGTISRIFLNLENTSCTFRSRRQNMTLGGVNMAEDVSYGCHKISVQSLIQYIPYIFIPLSSFLPIQSSPAHISYLYKAGVSWLASPLKAPHICLLETWNQWLLHMRQLHLHPCPSPNVMRSTYFGKKYLYLQKEVQISKHFCYNEQTVQCTYTNTLTLPLCVPKNSAQLIPQGKLVEKG